MPKKKTEVKILGFTLVIVGAGFSPNNFNGDMLAEKEIVPNDWNWKVSNSVSTPILSQITYEEGKVSIRVEKNKITITDNTIDNNKVEDSKVAEIAKRLMQRQRHLTFTALGINFDTIAIIENFKGYLRSNFIKENKILSKENALDSVSITLQYGLKNGGILNLVLDEGVMARQMDKETEEYNGIVASANFHRDFSSNTDNAIIFSRLNHIKEDKQKLKNILQSIIEQND